MTIMQSRDTPTSVHCRHNLPQNREIRVSCFQDQGQFCEGFIAEIRSTPAPCAACAINRDIQLKGNILTFNYI